MDSLKFNFVRRAFIVPVLLSAVVIAIIWFAAPKIIESSNAVSVAAVSDVNISKYNLNEYNKFSQLKSGGYVATVNCKNPAVSCPVLYLDDIETGTAYMSKNSTEPWNNGTVAFVGDNFDSEFKSLHSAKVGDKIYVNFYKHGTYTYKVTKITANKKLSDLKLYEKQKNKLILCLPYTDFESADNSLIYTFFIAESEVA